jgi:hypothetical protein
MKKSSLIILILFILVVLICGIFTSTHTTKLIAPFFLNGKLFESRSSTVQNVFYIVFSLGFSIAYFFIFTFFWTTLHFNKVFKRFYQFFYPKIQPWLPCIEKSPWLIRGLVIVIALIGILLLAIQIKIITFPFQLELREGVIQLSTQALLNGINPYTLGNNPVYINVYGILYNAVVLPFAALFGNSLQLHRLINALFILGQLFLMAKVMRLRKTGWMAIFITLLFMWLGQIFLTSPLARPDIFGELLFLLTLFIPLIYKFNTPSLIISMILGILTYQTKAYFFLGVIIIASYLFFFISKRRALFYAASAGALFLLSILALHQYLENYFVNTLYMAIGTTSRNYSYLLMQSFKFLRDYWGLILTGIGTLFVIADRTRINDFFRIKFDFKNYGNPLLSIHMDFLLYSLIITSLSVLLIFGEHSGTFMTYYYQLITPFLVMVVLTLIDKQKTNKNWLLLLAVLTLLTQSYENLKTDFLLFESPEWLKLEARISKSNQILNSPLDVSILIDQGKPIAMSGNTQFFFLYPTKPFFLYTDPEKIREEGNNYLGQIVSKIKNKEYDFLETMQNENYELFLIGERLNPPQSDISLISGYYHLVETLAIPMPHTYENWKIGIWEPN